MPMGCTLAYIDDIVTCSDDFARHLIDIEGPGQPTELNGRLAKYQIAIMGYDVTIEYRPGKQNTVSDALSRNPPLENSVNTIVHSQLPTLDEVRTEQEKSPHFSRIQALRNEPEQIEENNDVTGNNGTEDNTQICNGK
ncbi:hypothetical protein ANCDUO_04947 [Ancylostoma duodenale]|uniref:Reverse transcriptase RNase H-like domain-containing protein n=1 Tax=Ancylostoma duodenale TaxID=51022 RepID=A0A0C2GTU4_9BILA|nr:hypothetical protein ANCDUO_04947 [Ancylostoma duodenale]